MTPTPFLDPVPPPVPASRLPAKNWVPQTVVLFVAAAFLGCALVDFALVAAARRLAPDSEVALIVAHQLALQIPVVVAAHFFLRLHGRGWRDGFGLRWEPRPVLLGAGAGIAAVLVGYPLEYATVKLCERFHHHLPQQEAVLLITRANAGERWLLAVVAIGGAAFAEEILFRGVLYQSLRDTGFRRAALWGTAILFGAIHVNAAAFVPLALFGALLAWLYEKTGTLTTGIAAHAAFNLVGFLSAVFFGDPNAPR